MTQKQRHKNRMSENMAASDNDNGDDVHDDRPRSILKPTQSTDVPLRPSKPTFAQGVMRLTLLPFAIVIVSSVMSS